MSTLPAPPRRDDQPESHPQGAASRSERAAGACPKCGAARADGDAECRACGVVYAKVEARLSRAAAARQQRCAPDALALPARARQASPLPSHGLGSAGQVHLGSPAASTDAPPADPEPESRIATVARAALWVCLLVATVRFAAHSVASNFAGESPLHLVDLVFHEAGHVLFSPFGRVLMVLGGSLTQVLVPLACAVAFLRRGDRFATSVAAWWAGQNLVDIAPYVNDARALQLVLLGGRTGAEVEGHDWEFLLQTFGCLHRDHGIAAAFHAAGLAIMAGALAWGAWLVVTSWVHTTKVRRNAAPAQLSSGGADSPIGR